MRYANVTEMDKRIERIVKAKVKHYYTDWKNYDRPKYMKYKGIKGTVLILAVRNMGCWLWTIDETEDSPTYEYVKKYEQYRHEFYKIDIDRREVTKLKEVA